jgi:hypothetical protein
MGWARRVAGGLTAAVAVSVGIGAILAASCAWAATIVVSNRNDIVNGTTSSPRSLARSPGPDGISLREALLAANNAPGPHEITFAPRLAGRAIALAAPLPPITRSRITLTGLTTAAGRPDVTIDGRGAGSTGPTLHVRASSFTLQHVRFMYTPPHFSTIQIGGTLPGGPPAPPLVAHVRIRGNAFLHDGSATDGFAINVVTSLGVAGTTIRDVVVDGNRFVRLFEGVNVTAAGRDNVIEDIVVHGNAFSEMTAPASGAVEVGGHDGVNNVVRRVRIVRNTFTGNFIGVALNHNRDSGPPCGCIDTTTSGNVLDDTLITGNVFTGNLEAISIVAGTAVEAHLSLSDNEISSTRVVNNVIDRTGFLASPGAVALHVIDNLNGATDNRVTGLAIVNNTILTTDVPGPPAVMLESSGGITGVSIRNTIFWGRHADEIAGVPPRKVVSSILSQAAYLDRNGNFHADPLFVNPGAGNFRLQAVSPAIGAGASGGAPAADLDCRPRGTPPSIGAFEGTGPSVCPTSWP